MLDSLLLGVVLILSVHSVPVYLFVFNSARLLSVAAVAAGCLVLWHGKNLRQLQRRQLYLVLAIGAWAGLNQFPSSWNTYFCYVAPLVAVSVLAVVSAQRSIRVPVHAIALAFYFLFALAALNRGYLGFPWVHIGDMNTPLALPRASLRVQNDVRSVYATLIGLVVQHRRGDYIYAAPDCPEVYFLSGSRNPTPQVFDFFRRTETENIPSVIERHGITVVVLNSRPFFSGPPDAQLTEALRRRFPQSAIAGPFEVRWRE